MIHNACLKRVPADWSKAPKDATNFVRLANGLQFFMTEELKSPFADSICVSSDYRVVYREKRPTVISKVYTELNGERMHFEFPTALTQSEAETYLRQDGIYSKGMKVFVSYKDVPNVG